MFTAEVYAKILRHLTRDDLDSIQLCDRRSNNVVKRNFGAEAKTEDKGPLRVLYELRIRNTGGYSIKRGVDSEEVVFNGEEELMALMKNALLENLRMVDFSSETDPPMDERLLNVLLPLRGAWKTGRCWVPYLYSSPSVRERMLDELLLCEEMYVDQSCDFGLERSWLSYASVQQCRALDWPADYHLDTDELFAWLHRDNQWNKPTELVVWGERNIDLHTLLEALKESFVNATKPQKYSILVLSGPMVNDEVLHNDTTSERLRISQDGSQDDRIVHVERLPAEQK